MPKPVQWWQLALPWPVTNRLLAERQSLLAADIERLRKELTAPALIVTAGKPKDEP